MRPRILAVALAGFFCSCSPGSPSFELVDEKVRKSAEASAREFIEEKSPAGRPLPAALAAARTHWVEQLQCLQPGMPGSEAQETLIRFGARAEVSWCFVTVYALDDDWSVALAWNAAQENETETLMGWRLYGFPEWAAALPRGDIELICEIRHVPSPEDDDRDPVQLLRVVNRFVAAGREKSLEAIEAYHLVGGPMCREFLWEVTPSGDERAGVLLECLFESRDGELFPLGSLRDWFQGVASPVMVEGGLPFVLKPFQGAFASWPVRDQLRWAEKHGTFRQSPLVPSSGPAAIADDLLRQLPTDRARTCFEAQVWSQALAACGDRFPGTARPSQLSRLDRDLREVIVERLRATPLAWDASSEKFVSSR